MKQNLLIQSCCILFALAPCSSFAQSSLVTASNADQKLSYVSSNHNSQSLSSASIGYSGGKITAVASGGDPNGTTPPMIVFSDGNSTANAVLAYYPTWAGTAPIHPDVVIGNDLTNTNDYIAGVIYEHGITTDGLAIELYYERYRVYWDGTGTLQDSLIARDTLGGAGGNYNPHIAILADYANTMSGGTSSGLATCDRVILSYTMVATAGFNAWTYIYTSHLNSLPVDTPALFRSYIGINTLNDVAATQIQDPSTGNIKNILLIGTIVKTQGTSSLPFLTNPSMQYLGVMQFDLDAPPFSPHLGFDLDSGIFSLPCITALNDYRSNGYGAYWALTVKSNAIGHMGERVFVYTHPDTTVPTSQKTYASYPLFHDSSVVAGTNPAISAGPGTQFTLQYNSFDPFPPPPGKPPYTPVFIAQNIGVSGLRVDSNYYKVPLTHPYIYGQTLTSSCNTSDDVLFTGWQVSTDTLYYKTTTTPGAFKHAAIDNTLSNNQWSIYPNPASGSITISFNGKLNHNNFIISNIVGQQVAYGPINNHTQQVNIETLPAGTYLLTIYTGNQVSKIEKIIKE